MRKGIRKFLIASLALMSMGLMCVACKGTTGSSSNSAPLEGMTFAEEYFAVYGEIYYFEDYIFNGKPLEYSVTLNGEAIEVRNYGFLVDSMNSYEVTVKDQASKEVLGAFKVAVKDNGAPHIAFSYQQKFVLADTMVELPTVSVADNADKDIQYTAELTKDGEKVTISEQSFVAQKGEYIYTASATDSSGNTTKKTCLITAGGELDVARLVNWSNPNTDVEYCREISGGTMSTSDEVAYGGFDSSFKVTINDATATTCITVKNALIDDISEYDYLLMYVYNDMTDSRRYSVNWSPQHVGVLNMGEWVPIIYPINENLVTDSNNAIYRETQDWTNGNGLRLYIQDSGAASGSVYLTDIFLLDVPDETKLFDDLAAFEALTASEEWQMQYNLIDAEYNVLKADGAQIDLNAVTGRTTAKYSQLALGEGYDENTLAYADESLKISQLIGFGDVWSLPAGVNKNTQVKYGEENGSFEITFRLDRDRANTALINPSVYKEAPAGEVVFMVKNATKSRLKIYTVETADTGVWPIEVSDEWQEVRLAVNSSYPLSVLEIILYTMDDPLVQPLDDGTAKIYYSNIRFVPCEDEGEFLPMNETYAMTYTNRWAGNEVVSFTTEEDKLYDSHGVLSVKLDDYLTGGRFGFYLNRSKLQALLGQGAVKLTVTYNASNVSDLGKYIGFYGMSTTQAERGNGWYKASTTFTQMPEHFILAIGSTGTFAWEGYGIKGELLIADISYEIVEPPKFSLTASTEPWQDPASVAESQDFAYGEEEVSTKVGFKVGYKYANVNILPHIDITTGYIEFYVKNATGVALEFYIYPEEVIEVSTSEEWQRVRLAVDPSEIQYSLKVRGKNETVVNDTANAYYYISSVNVSE